MTHADYAAFNAAGGNLLAGWDAEQGHHVELVLLGDYNEDGVVDAADYTVWRDNLGGPGDSLPNHNDLGAIGNAHYATWRAHYGTSAPLTPPTSAGVPEPATLLLGCLALAALGTLSRKR